MSEYTEQAENFLALYGLEFRVVLVGEDCPQFCEDAQAERDMEKLGTFPRKTHIHGKHYRCTLSGQGRGHVSFDFWNSYSDEEFNFAKKNPEKFSYAHLDRIFGKRGYTDGSLGVLTLKHKVRTVLAYDLLACIQKSDVGTFEEFCSDFGYDTDSRKAEGVYLSVKKEWHKVHKFFTETELDALQAIQ